MRRHNFRFTKKADSGQADVRREVFGHVCGDDVSDKPLLKRDMFLADDNDAIKKGWKPVVENWYEQAEANCVNENVEQLRKFRDRMDKKIGLHNHSSVIGGGLEPQIFPGHGLSKEEVFRGLKMPEQVDHAAFWEKVDRDRKEIIETEVDLLSPENTKKVMEAISSGPVIFVNSAVPSDDCRRMYIASVDPVEGDAPSAVSMFWSADSMDGIDMSLRSQEIFCEQFNREKRLSEDDEEDIYDAVANWRAEHKKAPWWIRALNWCRKVFGTDPLFYYKDWKDIVAKLKSKNK